MVSEAVKRDGVGGIAADLSWLAVHSLPPARPGLTGACLLLHAPACTALARPPSTRRRRSAGADRDGATVGAAARRRPSGAGRPQQHGGHVDHLDPAVAVGTARA